MVGIEAAGDDATSISVDNPAPIGARRLKPKPAHVDTGCMNACSDRLTISLSALIAEILAEHPDDRALRPLAMAPVANAAEMGALEAAPGVN